MWSFYLLTYRFAVRLLVVSLLFLALGPETRLRADPIALPQPAILPHFNPLCDSNLVGCLDIDDFGGHAYVNLMVLPKTDLREAAAVLPYGIALGLGGRLAGGISTQYQFWQQDGTMYNQHGPLRLNLTALLWPLLPLWQAPSASHSEMDGTYFTPPRHLRVGLTYENQLRVGPFDGANSLGLLTDLAALRLLAVKVFGPVEITASLGALYDWRGTFATGEAAAQLGVYLPFFRALKVYAEALVRGVPAYVKPGVILPLVDGDDALRRQAVIGGGLSFRPQARVDFGVSVQKGFGGLAPAAVLVRFAVLSVGRTYQGRAATPVAQLAADAVVEVAKAVDDYIRSLPIDPILDSHCMLFDDNGDLLVQQPIGTLSADGKHCLVQGEMLPIEEHLWRDRGKSVICRDEARTDCLLYRRPHEHGYRSLHRPWVGEDCVLRESVYDPDAPGLEKGSPYRVVKLAVLGKGTADRTGCTDEKGHIHKVGARYYREHGHLWICEAPRIEEQRDRCFMALAELPHNMKNEATGIGRIARALDQGATHKAESIDKMPDRAVQTAEDIAAGRINSGTIRSAVMAKARGVAHTLTKEGFKEFVDKNVAGLKSFFGQSVIEQGEDIAQEAGDAMVPNPVTVLATVAAGGGGRAVLAGTEELEEVAAAGKSGKKLATVGKKASAAAADTETVTPATTWTPPKLGYHPAPKELKGFPGARKVTPKTPVQGGGKLRARWADEDGNIYEWDYRHGNVEKYDKGLRHRGEFDSNTGSLVKGPDPSRKIQR